MPSAGKCIIPQPPAILAQPQNVTVITGDDANFSVAAWGTGPLSYQWYWNGTNSLTDGAKVSGARNATLTIMVGGRAEALERVRPLLQLLGKTITLCGGHGAGHGGVEEVLRDAREERLEELKRDVVDAAVAEVLEAPGRHALAGAGFPHQG